VKRSGVIPRQAHVDSSLELAADPEQGCGAAMAERGIFAARKHGGHPAAMSVECRPTHRIDAASNEVKAAGASGGARSRAS